MFLFHGLVFYWLSHLKNVFFVNEISVKTLWNVIIIRVADWCCWRHTYHVVCLYCLCVRHDRVVCKNGWTDRDALRGLLVWAQGTTQQIDWIHTGAIWWIRSNDPCSAAMRAIAIITLATCLDDKSVSVGLPLNYNEHKACFDVALATDQCAW